MVEILRTGPIALDLNFFEWALLLCLYGLYYYWPFILVGGALLIVVVRRRRLRQTVGNATLASEYAGRVWAARDELGPDSIDLLARAVSAIASSRLGSSVTVEERLAVDTAVAERAMALLERFGLIRNDSRHGYLLAVNRKVAFDIAARLRAVQ